MVEDPVNNICGRVVDKDVQATERFDAERDKLLHVLQDTDVPIDPNRSDAEGIVRVGPKGARKLQGGDSVQILISENGGSLIRASQRPKERPVRVAGFEATPLAFIGMIMSFSGAMVAMFSKHLS